MWIFLNNAMLSIVAHRRKPDTLLVRARVKGDIEAVFPQVAVFSLTNADYHYRAEVPRSEVAAALAQQIQEMAYDNFKRSVKDHARHDWYMDVWSLGHAVQQTAEPNP